MGTVYRARDLQTNERVAVKVLRVANEDLSLRLSAEGAALGAMQHPRIVRCLATGTSPEGLAFLALSWIDGETLGQRLKRAPLGVRESARLAMHVADALGEAHARGVIHRDVKPSNIMLGGNRIDGAVLLDFGVARTEDLSLTKTNLALGTPAYMAPEQARASRDLDARADVYSLGCVLFKCLTGRTPFEGSDSLELLSKILLGSAPLVSEFVTGVPPELEALVARMLANDREARPSDAREVTRALQLLEPTCGDDVTRKRNGRVRKGLTLEERRVLSIIFTGTGDDATAEWDVDSAIDRGARLAQLRAATAQFAARCELLVDGSLVVAFEGQGYAIDVAGRAAQCALVVRAAMPGAPIALATGSGVLRDDSGDGHAESEGDVFKRAAAIVSGARNEADHPARNLVAIDDVTARLIEGRFDVTATARGPMLRSARQNGDGTRTVLGRVSPFVGRERELEALLGMVAASFEESRSLVAIVSAAPGGGKSRLAAELEQRVKTSHPALTVWRTRADAMRSGAAFSVLSQLIRSVAHVRDADATQLRQRRIRDYVDERIAPRDRGRVAAFLCELVDAAMPDDADPQLAAARAAQSGVADQIRRAFEEIALAEAAARPLLMMLEDLHWCDRASLMAIDHLARTAGETRVAIVGLARPELADTHPRVFSERNPYHVRLGPLPRRASERLVRELLGATASDEIVSALVDRADGNPFFLEEMVRATALNAAASFPESVLATVQTRLEALPRNVRRALRAASIFGERFYADGVASLIGEVGDAAAVATAFELLAEREFIAPVRENSGSDEILFEFRHGLVREAAYTSLVDADRVVGHRLAGAWLEARGEAEAATLAEHYERGEERKQALSQWRRAAESALVNSDFEGATALARRGLSCAPEGDMQGGLLLIACEAAVWAGDFAEAHDRATDALACLTMGTSARCMAAALAVQASAWTAEDASGDWGRQALTDELALTRAPSAAAIVAALRAIDAFISARRPGDAKALLITVEPLARAEQGNPVVRGHLYSSLGMLAMLGEQDLSGAVAHQREALASFTTSGHRHAAARVRSNLGSTLVRLGSPEGVSTLRTCLAEVEALGLQVGVAATAMNLGLALAQAGELGEGRRLAQRAIGTFMAMGGAAPAARARLALSEICRLEGDCHQSLLLARAAADEPGDNQRKADASALIAAASLDQGDAEGALANSLEALSRFDHETGGQYEAVARLTRARALHALGRTDEARTAIGIAREALLRRAANLSPEWRASFLSNLVDHARTLELASDWLAQ